jgi:hypothetical protein
VKHFETNSTQFCFFWSFLKKGFNPTAAAAITEWKLYLRTQIVFLNFLLCLMYWFQNNTVSTTSMSRKGGQPQYHYHREGEKELVWLKLHPTLKGPAFCIQCKGRSYLLVCVCEQNALPFQPWTMSLSGQNVPGLKMINGFYVFRVTVEAAESR